MEKLVRLLEIIANKTFDIIKWPFIKLIPKSVSDKLKEIKNNQKKKLNNLVKNIVKKLKIKKDDLKISTKNAKVELQNIQSKLKEFDYKGHDYKADLIKVLTILLIPLFWAKKWVLTLRPSTILWIATGMSVGGIAFVNVYVSTKNIAKEEEKINTNYSEEIKTIDTTTSGGRGGVQDISHLHNIELRTFNLSDLYIPVYVEGSGGIRTLIFDITIVASNQYIKEYYKTNETLIRDRLSSKIETITPKFLLTSKIIAVKPRFIIIEEGKVIIKDKITEEINTLLKELDIKGHVKEIYINSIIAS